MNPKRWNTLKIVIAGAIFGALYSLWKTEFPWTTSELILYNGSRVVGGSAGGAILFGAVSAIRNYFAIK